MISEYKGFVIEVIDEPNYEPASVDNLNLYNAIYYDKSYSYPTKHGISIFKNDGKISSAIVMGNGGGTTIHERSYVLKYDDIFICCGEMVYSLKLPTLSLNWAKELDPATSFEIYDFEDDLIVHGEMSVSRVTSSGEIKWEFSARDIFVNLNGHKEFEIIGELIKLVDFENYEYILDANGEVITDRLLK